MEIFKLWDQAPGVIDYEPVLEYYPAKEKTTDATIVIFPGGGYTFRASDEGKDYAEYLNSIGMDAFVLQYRVSPYRFPVQLLDARRSIRFLRANAEKFGIHPNKIGVMGSSAGGHLAALTCTYREKLDIEGQDDVDKIDYLPNFQVLCYPVISLSDLAITNLQTTINLLGSTPDKLAIAKELNPALIADEETPKTFIWHTSNDSLVNVCNSLQYGEKLKSMNVLFEMHIFPDGVHGLGLANGTSHIAQWKELFVNWLKENFYI